MVNYDNIVLWTSHVWLLCIIEDRGACPQKDKRGSANLLALNSSGLALLSSLLGSLALLEERLGDQDLLSGWCSAVGTNNNVSSAQR